MKVTCVSNNNKTYDKTNFNGSVQKSVKTIFKDLSRDINGNTDGKIIGEPKKIYDKLTDFVAKTDKNVEMYWHNPSFLDLFSDNYYQGFMFRNKKNFKKIEGSAYPNNYFSDVVVHSGEEKYISNGAITAQGPNIHPDFRYTVSGSKSGVLDAFIEDCYRPLYTKYPGFIGIPGSDIPVSPYKGFIAKGVQKLIGLIPKVNVNKYNSGDLFEVGRYVDELTTKVEPKDIDKLLA